ncbi:MAG: hypothetical protein ACREJO_16585 [Phycisphaerales bacterium]
MRAFELGRPSCRAVAVFVGGSLPFFAAGVASGQVIEQGPFNSLLTTQTGNGGPSWQSWTLLSQNYGGGNNPNGVSGRIIHTYTGGTLEEIRVNINELRNSGAPFVTQPTAFGRVYGQTLFTPQVNTPYTILGSVSMYLGGTSTSSASASGIVTLEVVSGPTIASFGSSIYRSGHGGFPVLGDIYNANAPLSGSATGMLLAGITYQLTWDFNVSSNINGDTTLDSNVATGPGGSFFAINFAPTPGAATLLGLGGLVACRRRRI